MCFFAPKKYVFPMKQVTMWFIDTMMCAVCLVVSWITLINVEQNLFITENSFLTKKSNNPKSLEDMIKEDMI